MDGLLDHGVARDEDERAVVEEGRVQGDEGVVVELGVPGEVRLDQFGPPLQGLGKTADNHPGGRALDRRQRGVIVTGTSCLRSSAPSQTSSSVTGPKVNPAGKSGDGTVISSTSIGPLSPIPKLSRFGSPLSRRPCQKLTDALRAIEDSDAALRRSGGDAWRLATRELTHGRWIGLMSAAGWRIPHVSTGSRVSPIIVCVAWQRVELTANLFTAFSLRC